MKGFGKLINVVALSVLVFGCQKADLLTNAESKASTATPVTNTPSIKPSTTAEKKATPPKNNAKSEPKNGAELVDIQTINPHIVLDIRYATENNFMKRNVYGVARCVLRREVAEKLSQVQADLEKQQLGLKVYDCYRPLAVQKVMWQIVSARPYVANPARGSKHNRGAAVDLTLVDSNGQELEMPTEFDNFTFRAHRNYQGASREAKKNRSLLEEAMKNRGFIPLSKEWWHFDAVGWQKFEIMGVPLESIPALEQQQ